MPTIDELTRCWWSGCLSVPSPRFNANSLARCRVSVSRAQVQRASSAAVLSSVQVPACSSSDPRTLRVDATLSSLGSLSFHGPPPPLFFSQVSSCTSCIAAASAQRRRNPSTRLNVSPRSIARQNSDRQEISRRIFQIAQEHHPQRFLHRLPQVLPRRYQHQYFVIHTIFTVAHIRKHGGALGLYTSS